MLRRFCTLLSMLSLLVCVAMVVLWVRSYARSDDFLIDIDERHRAISGHYVVGSSRGIVFVGLGKTAMGSDDGFHLEHVRDDPQDILASRFPLPNENLGGVLYHWREFYYWQLPDDCSLSAPFWSLAVVTGIMPVLSCVRRCSKTFSRKRSKKGRCPGCGYDLRATPDRCPECGAVPAVSTVNQ